MQPFQPQVTLTSALGVRIDNVYESVICGPAVWLSWPELQAAASQLDALLEGVYSRLLEQAQSDAARRSPVDVIVYSHTGGATWRVALRARWSGSFTNARLGMGEGLDYGHHSHAVDEAKSIVARLRALGRETRIVDFRSGSILDSEESP